MELAMTNGFTELNQVEMENANGGIVLALGGLAIVAIIGIIGIGGSKGAEGAVHINNSANQRQQVINEIRNY